MSAPASVELENKEELIAELREKFKAKYIGENKSRLFYSFPSNT